MSDYVVPKALRARLAEVAKKHGFASGDALAAHFIERGLTASAVAEGELAARLSRLVDDFGYSSLEEAVEHLLVRGLRAYEEPTASREELEQRLRGLGYID